MINDDRKGTIAKYLGKDVKVVLLPKKYHSRNRTEENTYPPLVLDGASGTGKTQQAFALLKSGKQVVYLVMANPPRGKKEQGIYNKMRKVHGDG